MKREKVGREKEELGRRGRERRMGRREGGVLGMTGSNL